MTIHAAATIATEQSIHPVHSALERAVLSGGCENKRCARDQLSSGAAGGISVEIPKKAAPTTSSNHVSQIWQEENRTNPTHCQRHHRSRQSTNSATNFAARPFRISIFLSHPNLANMGPWTHVAMLSLLISACGFSRRRAIDRRLGYKFEAG